MAPNLVRSLISGMADGKYAMTLGQGTDLPFFLARSQDKTFWIQVRIFNCMFVFYDLY